MLIWRTIPFASSSKSERVLSGLNGRRADADGAFHMVEQHSEEA